MFIFLLLYPFSSLDTGHSLAKVEKIYNPIEFWDRLLNYTDIKRIHLEQGDMGASIEYAISKKK